MKDRCEHKTLKKKPCKNSQQIGNACRIHGIKAIRKAFQDAGLCKTGTWKKR